MVNIKKFIVGSLATNTYLVYDRQGEGIIIDPGYPDAKVLDFVKKNSIKLKYILLTHGHFDHVSFALDLKKETEAKIALSEKEIPMMEGSYLWAGKQNGYPFNRFIPDILLKDGDILKIGKFMVSVITTPGHSPAGLCFYLKKEHLLFTGDTLFAGAIGRTDLPGSSLEEIWRSIREKIFSLPDKTRILPGHSVESSIKLEKK